MAEAYGWRSGFYVFGILGVFLGAVLFLVSENPTRGQAEAPAPSAALPAHVAPSSGGLPSPAFSRSRPC